MTEKKTQPFISVVLITLNGAHTIGQTIDSLLAQTYPKDRYELIVVDDGSTDNTEEVVNKYPDVRLIKHGKNKGISAARNTGLEAAKGEIYVQFDDDCVANPEWLETLASGYKHENVAGVGGISVTPDDSHDIVSAYVAACGGPSPASASGNAGHARPLRRLWNYLTAWKKKDTSVESPVFEVSELYGANCSFPMDELRAVGGWDPRMTDIEDRDLCRRIRQAFPDRRFYAMTAAKVSTKPRLSLMRYLRRPYKRGPVTLRFYQANKQMPPFFPSPLLFITACVVAIVLQPLLLFPVVIGLPQVLYFWWPIRAVRNHRPVTLLFSYIQLSEESMVGLGIIRGYWQQLTHKTRLVKVLFACGRFGLIALWTVLTLDGHFSPIQAGFSLGFLLLVPGNLLLRVIIGYAPNLTPGKILSYSLGLGLILLMVAGLALNELYVITNQANPLSTRPLVLTISIFCVILTCLATWRIRHHQMAPWTFSRLVVRRFGIGLALLLLPVLAVGGAVTLNNGGSPWLAIITLLASGIVLFVLSARPKVSEGWYPLGLYVASLVILLGTSMRGWNITGHDVMQEFQVFQLTLQHHVWSMHFYQDAYMACLSITILPTILQVLTGIGAQYIFKFVFQIFAALMAPVLYMALRRYVHQKVAFLAAIIFITFPTFFTDAMMLNRQETALLCLLLSLQAGLEKSLPWWLRQSLAFIFMLGMVFSHYSTSYIMVAALILAICLQHGVGLLNRWRSSARTAAPSRPSERPIYGVALVIGTLCAIIVWNGLATHTTDNFAKIIQAAGQELPAPIGDGGANGQNLVSVPTNFASYLTYIHDNRPFQTNQYYSGSTTAQYPPTQVAEPTTPPTAVSRMLHLPATILTAAYNVCRTAYGALIAGLTFLGILIYCFRRRRIVVPEQYLWLGIASFLLIVIQLALPLGIVNYGLTRLILQSLLFLGVPIILAALQIFSWVHIPKPALSGVIGGSIIVLFFVLSGAIPAITGSFKPVLAFSNSGPYYEQYYTHQDEINAGQWLDTETPKGSRVYADEFTRRKLITYADIFAQPTLMPFALPQDSYVFLSYANTTFGEVPAYAGPNLVFYSTPTSFLVNNKNLVYDSGAVQIYK